MRIKFPGLYLGNSDVGSAYGAAGSLIILLLWVYYSTQILFFGAEFTQVYTNQYGSRVAADDNALPLTEEQRARQGLTRQGLPAATPRPRLPVPATASGDNRYAAAVLSFAAGLSAGVMVALRSARSKLDRPHRRRHLVRGPRSRSTLI